MPQHSFEDFCSRYNAIRLDGDAGDAIDIERAQWRHGTMDVTAKR
jgi:hypothetical protein